MNHQLMYKDNVPKFTLSVMKWNAFERKHGQDAQRCAVSVVRSPRQGWSSQLFDAFLEGEAASWRSWAYVISKLERILFLL